MRAVGARYVTAAHTTRGTDECSSAAGANRHDALDFKLT
jgi:hypothetical protein